MIIINKPHFCLILLLSSFFFVNCYKNTQDDSKIIWILSKTSKDIKIESEWYYNEKKDSVKNQQKIIRKGILDSLNSHFYEFGLIQSKNGKDFLGSLKFYSALDTTKNVLNKKVEFSFIQETIDSIFYKTYQFDNNTNEVTFEYSKLDDQIITGFIREVLTVETKDKEKVRIIENITLVDNKSNNLNPAIDRIINKNN